MEKRVAALFVRKDSIYKMIAGCDAYDIDRDARNYDGPHPVIAHPPCRAWGRLRHFAKPAPGEQELAILAIELVRRWGGVLEHPHASLLWKTQELCAPGQPKDKYGGWSMLVNQHWWGHRAEKATLLYICGCEPKSLPPMPIRLEEPTHVVQSRKRKDYRPHITKVEREHTPLAFALWLRNLAMICEART